MNVPSAPCNGTTTVNDGWQQQGDQTKTVFDIAVMDMDMNMNMDMDTVGSSRRLIPWLYFSSPLILFFVNCH